MEIYLISRHWGLLKISKRPWPSMGSGEPQIQFSNNPKMRKRFCKNLLRGSRGPSTVTLIALQYVATWGGSVLTVIVKVNVFPKAQVNKKRRKKK